MKEHLAKAQWIEEVMSMNQLTQKEQMYLKDAKKHEDLCVAKYNAYTSAVSCQQLKQILQYAGQQEQNHLQTVTQMMQGQIPQMGAGSGGQGAYGPQMGQQHMGGQGSYQQYGQQGGSQGQGQSYTGSTTGAQASQSQYTGQGQLSDEQICNDLLTTEKAVSDMYDHAVFESSNQQMRQALNHIQKEEQEHAFAIFQYMQSKGWYQ